MESSLEATPRRWADICLEEFGAGSIGELAAEEICPNAIVLVEEVAANSLPIIGRGNDAAEKNCMDKEKMLEIVVQWRAELQRFVHVFEGWLMGRLGAKNGYDKSKSKKKSKGSRELANLVSSINYDH